MLGGCRSQRSAFGWSWVAGTFFFVANMWWMAAVTPAGMVGLMCILGLYWGYAGLIVRGAGLLRPTDDATVPSTWRTPWRWPAVRLLLVAAAWVAAAEWFRGTWPWHGLPWLYLGYTQSPVLALCQVADLTGVAGVSFAVVVVNGWVALWVLDRLSVRRLVPAGAVAVGTVAAVVGYGLYRLRTEPANLVDGPRVLVVQPNFHQSNDTGQKGATPERLVDFHLRTTRQAVARTPGVDLIVWSETMMPPLAPLDREYLGGDLGDLARTTYPDLKDLAYDNRAALLTGGEYVGVETEAGGTRARFTRPGNVAYFFDRSGMMADQRSTGRSTSSPTASSSRSSRGARRCTGWPCTWARRTWPTTSWSRGARTT